MISTSSKTSACSALTEEENSSVSAEASCTLFAIVMPRSSKNIVRVSWAV